LRFIAGLCLLWFFIWVWTVLDLMDAEGTGEIRIFKRRRK